MEMGCKKRSWKILTLLFVTVSFASCFTGQPNTGRQKPVGSEHNPHPSNEYDVVIVGGGLVGTATAVALHRQGVKNIKVFEKSAGRKRIGAAIGLYPNGMAALGYIHPEIKKTIAETAIPTRFFERRDLEDNLVKRTDVQEIQATSPLLFPWYRLQELLADALPSEAVETGCSFECYTIDTDGQVMVTVRDERGQTKEMKCSVLIGADGIHSSVRQNLLHEPEPLIQHHGKVMYRAVLDKCAVVGCPPAGTQMSYQSQEKGKSFSFRETTPDVVTVTAAALWDDPSQLDTIPDLRKQRLGKLFEDFPVQNIIHSIEPSAIHEDCIRSVAIPDKWSDGPAVILGDAAHAMTPHMGQGANMGLEDVCELVHRLAPVLLSGGSVSVSSALEKFWKSRIERVNEVHERSSLNSVQSNTFDKDSASIPFQRRKYSSDFKDRLYSWRPPETR